MVGFCVALASLLFHWHEGNGWNILTGKKINLVHFTVYWEYNKTAFKDSEGRFSVVVSKAAST